MDINKLISCQWTDHVRKKLSGRRVSKEDGYEERFEDEEIKKTKS